MAADFASDINCLKGSLSCAAPKIFVAAHAQPLVCSCARQCELPLCRSCWKRMRQVQFCGIPSALSNDNFYGYPAGLLYQHRVRWIETAAASPLWTSMVRFYLEADRGHVLEEPVHRAEHRLAIRGNISAVSLPWEDIYGHFAQMTPQDRIATLPHCAACLARNGESHGERHAACWASGLGSRCPPSAPCRRCTLGPFSWYSTSNVCNLRRHASRAEATFSLQSPSGVWHRRNLSSDHRRAKPT